MSAICGLRRGSGGTPSPGACQGMLDAQAIYGPHRRDVRAIGEVAFGRALFRMLPEDRFDRQPLSGGDGRFLLVADLRIDNRPALSAVLGLDASRAAGMSDADVLMAGFLRWGEGVVDHLVGDFAFAVWDAHAARLLLARDPLGQRPLCYHVGGGGFAFASMPRGIHALGRVAAAPDEQRIAEYMADLVFPNGRSFFDGISVVEPGRIVVVEDGRVRARRYWNPRPTPLRLGSMDDYVEAYRERLDEAVESRLRGCDGAVAAHLSSGYDSSAVAATAARLLRPAGGRVVAFTSAPREGFDGAPARGRIDDESGLAAITATLHPNMEHVVLRPSATDAFSLLKQSIAAAQHPLGHVCNNVWWSAINRGAGERGLRVILTGETGNLTISAGGLFQLADMVRTGRWRTWAREARALIGGGEVNWRGVLANSFGPWMPRPAWKLLSHAFLRTGLAPTPSLLTPRWAEAMVPRVRTSGREIRPPRDSTKLRVRLLQWQDAGNSRKMALARWGVDERDPTTDRRLIEFCLSLPADMLLKDGRRRPLARAALADRLPAAVLDNPLRGHQMADWYEQITAADVRASFAEVRASAAAGAIIDLDRLGAMIDAWPRTGWETLSVVSEYRMQALHALSAAHFVDGIGADGGGESRFLP